MNYKFGYLPLKKSKESEKQKFWDNTNQISKISYRINSYLTIFLKAFIKGVPLSQLLRTRFAFYIRDATKPPCIHIELTNACNLSCSYCNNPLFSYPREMMSSKTFINTIDELIKTKQERVVVGGGEATLHPQFMNFSNKLSKSVKYLSIVTNAQWKDEKIAETLINEYNLIEISVDAGGKIAYENSRIGGDYKLLKDNLLLLKHLKNIKKSSSQINIRLMVRPSQKEFESKELKFWKKYCDTIMPQYIIKVDKELKDKDVFFPLQLVENSFPKCSYTLRDLQIRVNGDIPLCMVSGSRIEKDKKLILGNINNNSILEIWNGSIMNQYRNAHRNSDKTLMPICKGCRGC